MELRKLQDLELKGKRVLLRVDFNVPQDEQLAITDDTRIRAALPTIEYILKAGGRVILMSHLGRPKGAPDLKYSLAPCAKRLSELLKRPVDFPEGSGDLVMLENLRFNPAEEKGDPAFAQQLALLGDCYVDDAFGAAHREHASIVALPKCFPGKAAAGLLLQKEVEFLGKALLNPQRPFYAIIGGAKVSSKLGVLLALLNKVDSLFIGGGMSYTFLKALGVPIGTSLVEDDLLEKAKEIMQVAKDKGVKIFLPEDHLFKGTAALDIGPRTVELWTHTLKKAKTILWNGPVGYFEDAAFAKGTESIARALSESSAITIVGGGDSVAALTKLQLVDKISHVSTGGGAALEFIELGTLPGLEILRFDK